MKISDFVASVGASNGMARTNRFSVVINLPSILNTDGITPFNQLLLFCDQVQLPGITVNTVENRVYGEVRETPTEFKYDPITFSFYVDSNMHLLAYFNAWAKSVQYGDRRTQRYYNEYICPQMQILTQDTQDNTRFQYTLYEAWPKSVGSIQMDYASKDLMKMSVSMVFKYWDYMTIPIGDTSGQPTTSNPLGLSPGEQIIAGDINQIQQIPQQYLSNFNSFQANLASNLNSNPNQLLNTALNQGGQNFNIGNPLGDLSGFGGNW